MDTQTRRVALVTGGSRGIGAAIARRLAADGHDVALTYRQAAGDAAAVVGEVEAQGRRGLAIPADSADPAALVGAVERTVAELGRLDVLVNSAGVFASGPLEAVPLAQVDAVLAVHVRAAYVASQAAARVMGPGASIVSIGSCMAERVPVAGLTLYAMSKSALTGLTKGLARDLGARGITANLVHPGPTDTDMNPARPVPVGDERRPVAVGRYADADEVAATVGHLVGPGARYVTGAAIAVDGGFAA